MAKIAPLDQGCVLRHAVRAVAVVELTKHLETHFPQLGGGPRTFDVTTVAEAIRELERIAPGFAFYVCDERGRLRRHVNVFVQEEMIVDRRELGDRLDENSRVFIAQALSGG